MARFASGKFGTVTVLNLTLATKRMAKGKLSTPDRPPDPLPPYLPGLTFGGVARRDEVGALPRWARPFAAPTA
jgi:hypothetical protein